MTSKMEWSMSHSPSADTKATVTSPASATRRHVLTGLTAVLTAGTSAPTPVVLRVYVRDGAADSGAVLWQAVIAVPAVAGHTSPPIILENLNIVGTVNTAMTVEFSGQGGANTFQSIAAVGYSQVV